MTEVTKRKRRRQEYVLTKAARLLRLTFVILAMLGLWSAGLWAVAPFFTVWSNPPRPVSIPVGVWLIFIPFGIVAYRAWRMLKRAEWDFEMVAYVPPVTADTLPADEILVRGSNEATPHREMLLRAATSENTPKEELLRATEKG